MEQISKDCFQPTMGNSQIMHKYNIKLIKVLLDEVHPMYVTGSNVRSKLLMMDKPNIEMLTKEYVMDYKFHPYDPCNEWKVDLLLNYLLCLNSLLIKITLFTDYRYICQL